jgi:hypothetical protein
MPSIEKLKAVLDVAVKGKKAEKDHFSNMIFAQ